MPSFDDVAVSVFCAGVYFCVKYRPRYQSPLTCIFDSPLLVRYYIVCCYVQSVIRNHHMIKYIVINWLAKANVQQTFLYM